MSAGLLMDSEKLARVVCEFPRYSIDIWVLWYNLRKILHGGQRMAKVENGVETLRLSRHKRYRRVRRQTRRQTNLR